MPTITRAFQRDAVQTNAFQTSEYDVALSLGPRVYGHQRSSDPSPGTLIDPDHPLAQGLVAAWILNEGTGRTILDASVFRHRGVFDSTTGEKWTGGRTGHAIQFDATGGITVPNHKSFQFKLQMTMAGYVQIATTSDENQIADKNGNSGYRYKVSSAVSSNQVSFLDRGAANNITAAKTLSVGVWYHVAVTGGPLGLRIYIDGRLEASNSTAFDPGGGSDSGNLFIAKSVVANERMNGWIDSLFAWNRVLSPAEIAWHRHETYAMFTPAPVTRRVFFSMVVGAGNQRITLTAPAAGITAPFPTLIAGNQRVTVTASTAVRLAGAVTRAAGVQSATITAPVVTLSLVMIRAAGIQPLTLTASPAVRVAGAVVRAAGVQQITLSGSAVAKSGYTLPAGNQRITLTASIPKLLLKLPAGMQSITATVPQAITIYPVEHSWSVLHKLDALLLQSWTVLPVVSTSPLTHTWTVIEPPPPLPHRWNVVGDVFTPFGVDPVTGDALPSPAGAVQRPVASKDKTP